jgi:hypothetical protein
MDHVVYLDFRSNELDNIKSGKKTMIIRGAMGRKMPYGRVNVNDTLYFPENKGDGLIKGKAIVEDVLNTEKLTKEQSFEIVEQHQEKLLLGEALKKRFAGKKYLVLISIRSFEPLIPFRIDKSNYFEISLFRFHLLF